jgi:hypothetical protein
VEPPFNIPQCKVFPPLNIQIQWSHISHLSVKSPPFKIFLTFVFKSANPSGNLISGFFRCTSHNGQCKAIVVWWTLSWWPRYSAANGLKYTQFKINVFKRLFCMLWQFSSWKLLHWSFNSYMNWFICTFLTLMVVDLISSYPTHWFPLQAYGTFCWSSHFTFHVLCFSQICTSKKS